MIKHCLVVFVTVKLCFEISKVVSLYPGMGLLDTDTHTILFKQLYKEIQFTTPVVQYLFFMLSVPIPPNYCAPTPIIPIPPLPTQAVSLKHILKEKQGDYLYPIRTIHILNLDSKTFFPSLFIVDCADQYQYLGNCAPTALGCTIAQILILTNCSSTTAFAKKVYVKLS